MDSTWTDGFNKCLDICKIIILLYSWWFLYLMVWTILKKVFGLIYDSTLVFDAVPTVYVEIHLGEV